MSVANIVGLSLIVVVAVAMIVIPIVVEHISQAHARKEIIQRVKARRRIIKID